jgi:putative transposase
MPQPRKSLINLSDTPYYHCVSRCVRRAFLCGEDIHSGRSYEHRRKWVENRLIKLGRIFCIDICAYAVMHNHSHIVLHVNKEKAQKLTTLEVLQRWHALHKGTLLTRRYLDASQRGCMSEVELAAVLSTAKIYRARLYDLSWFMRLLNEYIARMANKEDNCTGRFWEGRFKSQALLDEAALLACMAYVDLNPVRARIAKQPIDALFTSARRRILAAKRQHSSKPLMPFVGATQAQKTIGLPFRLRDYLRLLQETCFKITRDRIDAPDYQNIKILKQAGLNQQHWGEWVTQIEIAFSSRVSLDIAKRKLATR